MPRETVRQKADRYLLEGRIVIARATHSMVLARVRGDGALYSTKWIHGDWACDCPHAAKSTDCCHLIAVKRVVAVDLEHQRLTANDTEGA